VPMSVARSTASFRDYRNAVDGQIEAGFTFGQIEDFINACALDEEQKAALWLWAWLDQSHGERRTLGDLEDLDASPDAGPTGLTGRMRRVLDTAGFPSRSRGASGCRTSS
jgi:hypothetical protein